MNSPVDNGSETVFVYALVDPRTKVIRYVGQTSSPNSRLLSHLNGGSNASVQEWIAELTGLGAWPQMVILRVAPRSEANQAESDEIALRYQCGSPLLNKVSLPADFGKAKQAAASELQMYSGPMRQPRAKHALLNALTAMSQSQLAEAIGASQPQISVWVNSNTEISLKYSLRIAKLLDFPCEWWGEPDPVATGAA